MFRITALYNTPRPRQLWIDGKFVQNPHGKEGENEKSEEAWVELFIDLVYVVLLLKLGDVFVYCYEESFILARVFILFWSLFLTRMAIDEYSNRFYSDDLMHKLIYLVYTSGVFVQVMNINTGIDESTDSHHCTYIPQYSVGIMSGILITRVSIILIHLLVMYHNPQAFNQFFFDIVRWSITTTIIIINFIVHYNGEMHEWIDFMLLAIIIVQETFVWLFSRMWYRKMYTYPIDLELFQARWGIWVMIVLGESIIQLLVPQLHLSSLTHNYVTDLIALVLMFSLAMQYYDACQREWFDHAVTQSAIAGAIWIWLHPLMTFFLFGIGVSIKMASKSGSQYELWSIPITSIGCGFVTMCFTLMRLSHMNFRVNSKNSIALFWIRGALSLLQISVLKWGIDSSLFVIIVQTVISVVGFNAIDILYDINFGVEIDQESVERMKQKSRPWASLPLSDSLAKWRLGSKRGHLQLDCDSSKLNHRLSTVRIKSNSAQENSEPGGNNNGTTEAANFDEEVGLSKKDIIVESLSKVASKYVSSSAVVPVASDVDDMETSGPRRRMPSFRREGSLYDVAVLPTKRSFVMPLSDAHKGNSNNDSSSGRNSSPSRSESFTGNGQFNRKSLRCNSTDSVPGQIDRMDSMASQGIQEIVDEFHEEDSIGVSAKIDSHSAKTTTKSFSIDSTNTSIKHTGRE